MLVHNVINGFTMVGDVLFVSKMNHFLNSNSLLHSDAGFIDVNDSNKVSKRIYIQGVKNP